MIVHFAPCFEPETVERVRGVLPRTVDVMNKMAPWRRGRWPTRVYCMSKDKIVKGRSKGAGHGYTYVPGGDVWLSPYLTWQGTWLVLVHEWGHHGWPDASENELNQVLVPEVFKRVTGKRLDMNWARRHGIGPPCPWGDRGFVGSMTECGCP